MDCTARRHTHWPHLPSQSFNASARPTATSCEWIALRADTHTHHQRHAGFSLAVPGAELADKSVFIHLPAQGHEVHEISGAQPGESATGGADGVMAVFAE